MCKQKGTKRKQERDLLEFSTGSKVILFSFVLFHCFAMIHSVGNSLWVLKSNYL